MELNPALLTEPMALIFYGNFKEVCCMHPRDFYLELKKYFLNHPDQFYATSPEYKYTLLTKFYIFLHENEYFTSSEEEKLFPPNVVDELISYCIPTNEVKNLATLIDLQKFFISKVKRFRCIDSIFEFVLKSPSLLNHPKIMETIQVKLLESSETYTNRRHYYNILFSRSENKRVGEDLITEGSKYPRIEG